MPKGGTDSASVPPFGICPLGGKTRRGTQTACLILALISCYSIHNSVTGVHITPAFGVLGYAMRLVGMAPALLALVSVLPWKRMLGKKRTDTTSEV